MKSAMGTVRLAAPWLLSAALCFTHLAAAGRAEPAEAGAQRAVDGAAAIWKLPEYATACMKIDAIVKKSAADLHLVREFDKNLGWVGPALGLTDAGLAFYKGKKIDGAQKVGDVSADLLICRARPVLCPAWAAGRTIGNVINGAVSVMREDKKDVTGLLEDLYLAGVQTDAEATALELLRLKEAIARIKERRQQVAASRTCADPRQTKAGLDELLRSLGVTQPTAPPLRSAPNSSCEILNDTRAAEALQARDADAYDALLAKCL